MRHTRFFIFVWSLAAASLLHPFSHAGTRPEMSDFQKVELGMEKTEVIALLGSPWTSRRWEEQDRWTYRFHEKKGNVVSTVLQEILFKDGKVAYKGAPLAPKITAEEQDKINLQNDLDELEKWKQHQEKAKQARDEYEEWVREVSGKNVDPESVVPQFKPVK